jgi:leucyl-tRNA synthetase
VRLPTGHEDGLEVYTTRPDTLFGASFVGIAPEHPLAEQLAAADPAVAAFVAECRKGGTSEADIEGAEKLGRDTGLRVVHPLDPTKTLPVWIANFILMDYGTGAIFACPAHDQRDLDFARKYDLPVLPVVLPPGEDASTFQVGKEAYVGPGAIFNSEFLDGLDIEAAKTEAVNRIEAMDQGQGATVYRLRDWGVSRQRYWGCPIPVIHCAACGPVGVPEDQLPVVLPDDVAFDKPGNPLLRHPDLEEHQLPQLRRQGRARNRHAGHLRRQQLVLRPLHRPDRRRADQTRPRPTTGWRSTNISAASSTRCCTCCMPASSPRR